MKTKLLTLLHAMIVSIGTIFANGTHIDGLYYILDATNKTAEVTYKSRSSDGTDYNRSWNIETAIIPSSVTYNDVIYNVTSIGDGAFCMCSQLISVSISNSVTNIGSMAFRKCNKLVNVTIPNSVTSIGSGAFELCSKLTSIEIPSSVTTIESWTFCYTGLTSIDIPKGITSIENYAFRYSSDLTSLTIPSSVTNIGNGAFQGCNKLSLIYCELGAPLSIDNTTFESASPTIYIPNCAFAAFSVAPVWKDMALAPVSVNLAVMNNTGGVVVENCGQMEIEAIPYIGYHFKRWQDGNKENPRKYTLSQSNRNFIAEFEIDKYTITLNCDASQGSITGDKGKYNYDTDHTIEAVPNYGYHFTQWSDGETDNPREFTLVQDTTFTALFAPNKYKLTILYDNTYGEVVGDQGTFDYQSEHSIQVNAKYGYHFTSWSDGVTDNPRTLVLTQDTTITASFAPNKYRFEAFADAAMGIVTGEQGEFDYLTDHTIEAVPNYGYHLPNGVMAKQTIPESSLWYKILHSRLCSLQINTNLPFNTTTLMAKWLVIKAHSITFLSIQSKSTPNTVTILPHGQMV